MGKKKVAAGPRRSKSAARRTLQGHAAPPPTSDDVEALKRSLASARRARDEAERAALAKDQFVAVLAHELRTPLAALQIQTQLMRRVVADPVKLDRVCEAIDRSVRLQVQLVDDLLDVARIVTGKLKVALEPLDLPAVVRSTLDAMGSLAESADIELRAFVDQSVGAIAGDRTRLAQIVSNILANAIKFTPRGGRVDVVLERVEGVAHLRITDNGVGIEPHLLKHVFSRLTHSAASVRAHGGLGLGLAIVRYLVDAHGGSIRADSAGRGRGSTFQVTLPLIKAARTAPADWQTLSPETGPPAPVHHPRRLAGRTVLVVENDIGMREALADMLRETGALVGTAESASAGLALVRELRPEILICDLAMPDEDGHTFIRQVRALGEARGGDTPALALTALAGEVHHRRSLESGFQAYLTKPVDVNRLVEVLVELLDGPRTAAAGRARSSRSSRRVLTSET
jgi:two-component system CheB/CheR fusion protein